MCSQMSRQQPVPVRDCGYPTCSSYTRFWTGEVAAVRRMRAHVGSQSSETAEVQTHIRVYQDIYNEMFTYLMSYGT
jgi:hypothetical protein